MVLSRLTDPDVGLMTKSRSVFRCAIRGLPRASEGAHFICDTREERLSRRLVVAVHVVEGEILRAGKWMHEGANGSLEHAARRVAHHDRAEAGTAVGCHRGDLADALKVRRGLAVDQLERDARQKYAIEETFEDCRVAVIPNRCREDQRLGRAQSVDIALNRGGADGLVVIIEPFLPRHDRVEALGVEITVVDVVAAGRCLLYTSPSP